MASTSSRIFREPRSVQIAEPATPAIISALTSAEAWPTMMNATTAPE